MFTGFSKPNPIVQKIATQLIILFKIHLLFFYVEILHAVDPNHLLENEVLVTGLDLDLVC